MRHGMPIQSERSRRSRVVRALTQVHRTGALGLLARPLCRRRRPHRGIALALSIATLASAAAALALAAATLALTAAALAHAAAALLLLVLVIFVGINVERALSRLQTQTVCKFELQGRGQIATRRGGEAGLSLARATALLQIGKPQAPVSYRCRP